MADPDLVLRAADRLRELEASGVGLSEVLSGEAGRRWVRADCGGDPAIARAAFALVPPKARFIEEPEGSEPRPAAEGSQEGAGRRSWWRRMFGG